MCATAPLCLEAALSVVGALECVVRRCVGPEGGSVLFTKDTGQTLITRHGQRILNTLHLDHPIARVVLECVGAHERVTADGSKSFILLLAALLRGIHDSAGRPRRTYSNQADTRRLANQLLALTFNELDDVITHAVLPYTSRLIGFSGHEVDDGVLPALVDGYFAGRVSPSQAAALSPLLCELYRKVSHNEEGNAQETISFLSSHFSQLYVAMPGLPSSCSHLLEGLVLACNWSVWREAEGPLKALVVCESLDAAPLVCEGGVSVCFQQDWINRSESVLRERLAQILAGANVLLSSVKQSERVVECAGLNGVSVLDCCDSAQLDLLCKLSGAETGPPLVAPLTHCKRLRLWGCHYANLGVVPYGSLCVYTLALCAPTAGALEQNVSASQGVFRMLEHLSQSSLAHQIHTGSQTPQTCHNSEQPRGSPESRCSSLNFWDGVLKAGGVVPVGGAFEFLLHDSLLRHGNHDDSESRRLLAEAVLSIPKSLHSHKPRRFLQHHAGFMTKLQLLKHQISKLGPGLKVTAPEGSGSLRLEAVCSKHQLMASVLQCVNRLLCVGTILHTHTSLHKALASVSDESEDEWT